MGENSNTSPHNSDNLLRPLENGLVERFDTLFDAREKTLRKKVADLLKNKQEFLGRTFPSLITVGAEHPRLAGGVLYMFGIITRHVHGGSEAINSISRRFAERKATQKYAKDLRPVLHEMHEKAERSDTERTKPWTITELAQKIRETVPKERTVPDSVRREQARIVFQELKRARVTRELYDFRQSLVPVKYEKNGSTVDLGLNGCEYSVLNKESKTGKTMVFISQSAGNPMGVESFAVEYAMRTGDKVLIIGQPDGANGKMTKEFADAAVADANPPYFDFKRRFRPPTYEPHTQFMKQTITSLLPGDGRFDLYTHSGSGIFAKNLLNDPDFAKRVNNAVFLNPAGVTTMFTLLPQSFRRIMPFVSLFDLVRDIPHIFRGTYELDRNEIGHKPAFWFRDRVTVAIQSGTHYRQPGWDTMRVNGGKIVIYNGGRDRLVGGKSFTKFMEQRLRDTANPTPSPIELEYDKTGHHETPFTHPEDVLDRIAKHIPVYRQPAS